MKMEELERIPPQNFEAERAILRIMFHNNGVIPKMKEFFSESGDEFYRESHRILYKTMLKLFNEGVPVDLITLMDKLDKLGEDLEQVGGVNYLENFFLKEPPTIQKDGYSVDNLNHYIKIVYEKFLLRRLIMVCRQVSGLAYEGNIDSLKPYLLGRLIFSAEKILRFLKKEKRRKQDEKERSSAIADD